jgi:hypothetical protein
MSTPLLELEGTAEEIQQRLADFAGQRLHVTVRPVETPAEATPAGAQSPVDAALSAIWNRVPDAAWEQFPADFGDHLDHYLYGTPKQE